MKWLRTVAACIGTAALLAGCARAEAGSRIRVVASFYPFAYLAQVIGGSRVEVTDLTPPGGEPHDSILTPRNRQAIDDADLLLYMGPFGFQPEIEAVADQGGGPAVALGEGLGVDVAADPHVWLDPVLYARMAGRVATALAHRDPAHAADFRRRADGLQAKLRSVSRRFSAGLRSCRFSVAVVGHEAFGYLLGRYGLDQVGFSAVSPEGEPTPGRLEEARLAIEDGKAGAVFFEAGGEGADLARQFAATEHLRAYPLFTLEAEPPTGDALSAFRTDLRSLRKGLRCE